MKTLGATIALRNGIEYDFCFEECIKSVLPICEFVVIAEGGSTEMEPKRLEGMGITVAMVRDPDGYKVELVEQR